MLALFHVKFLIAFIFFPKLFATYWFHLAWDTCEKITTDYNRTVAEKWFRECEILFKEPIKSLLGFFF